jgi:hypothetical protein
MQPVGCSLLLYTPRLKDPWPRWDLPLLTSPGWHGDRCDCPTPRHVTTRPNSAARAKELTWGNKGVAANGLTSKNIIPKINDDPRRTCLMSPVESRHRHFVEMLTSDPIWCSQSVGRILYRSLSKWLTQGEKKINNQIYIPLTYD